jgi:hypothetical protein
MQELLCLQQIFLIFNEYVNPIGIIGVDKLVIEGVVNGRDLELDQIAELGDLLLILVNFHLWRTLHLRDRGWCLIIDILITGLDGLGCLSAITGPTCEVERDHLPLFSSLFLVHANINY